MLHRKIIPNQALGNFVSLLLAYRRILLFDLYDARLSVPLLEGDCRGRNKACIHIITFFALSLSAGYKRNGFPPACSLNPGISLKAFNSEFFFSMNSGVNTSLYTTAFSVMITNVQ